MAQFQRRFVQELTKPLIVRQCGDLGFSGDNLSDVISVDLYTDGEAYSGGGTCAGACICPDGSTVALTGAVSGKTASVTLTEDCFSIPGQIGIAIRVTSGTIKTTVLKAIYNVEPFATNNPVDPGSRIALDVGDLINQIDAAVESIPASADQLKAAMAPNFSSTTAYPAGAYVWNNGTLYRFTTAHAAGSWTGTDATAVALANDVADLKSAITDEQILEGCIYKNLVWKSGTVYDNTDTERDNPNRIITQHILVHTHHLFVSTDTTSNVSLYMYEYDKNYNYIRYRSWFSGYQYFVLNDATKYVRIILRNGDGTSSVDPSYGQYVTSVYELDPSASSKYMIYGDDYGTTWGYLHNDGTVEPASPSATDTFYYTDLIEIPKNIVTTYSFLKARGTSNVPSVAFYDENETFISKIYYGNTDEHTIKIPDNAAYYRLSSMTIALPMADAYLAFYINTIGLTVDTNKMLENLLIGEGDEWR